MNNEVILLSRPINFAVVQLPGRNFPGVVIQGDTLYSFVQRLEGLLHSLQTGDDEEEVMDGLEDIKAQLNEAMRHYESICAEHRISLPYKG